MFENWETPFYPPPSGFISETFVEKKIRRIPPLPFVGQFSSPKYFLEGFPYVSFVQEYIFHYLASSNPPRFYRLSTKSILLAVLSFLAVGISVARL